MLMLSDPEVIAMVNALLDDHGVPKEARQIYVTENLRMPAKQWLRWFEPLLDRYRKVTNQPGECRVEHDHWEGTMICGRSLPCPVHGSR